jgi:hypothetical protein
MGWDGWSGGSAKGGDGARQDTAPAVSLFVNRKAAARQERQRARSAGRKGKTIKAMQSRRVGQMRREEAAGRDGGFRPKSNWW